MRLTNKLIYCLRALCDLALNYRGRPISLKSISKRQDIPLAFLSQIFYLLKKTNLVKSGRGPTGGYYLAKEPSRVYLQDILEALGESATTIGYPKKAPLTSKKNYWSREDWAINLVLAKLEGEIKKVLTQTTLEDLIEETREHLQNQEFGHKYSFQI